MSSSSSSGDPNKNKKKLTLVAPAPIEMIDHVDQDQDQDKNNKCWCRNVMIGEYTIITGMNKIRFVVWTICITTKDHARIIIRKRYNEFVTLRQALVRDGLHQMIPQLPIKSALLNFDPQFLERRRNGLEFFLSSILLHPQLCQHPLVKLFVSL